MFCETKIIHTQTHKKKTNKKMTKLSNRFVDMAYALIKCTHTHSCCENEMRCMKEISTLQSILVSLEYSLVISSLRTLSNQPRNTSKYDI